MSADNVEQILEDPQKAAIQAPLKAALALAKAMTEAENDRAPIRDAIAEMKNLGLPAAAIDDAIAIAHHFNYINRVADTFDFRLPQGEGMRKLGRLLDWAKKVMVSKRPEPFLVLDPDSSLSLPADIVIGKKALLENSAELEPGVRRAIVDYCASLKGGAPAQAEVPEQIRALLGKIATAAYKIIDEDIENLRDQGYSDESIFELVVCAAFGASLAPLETAYAALQNSARKRDTAMPLAWLERRQPMKAAVQEREQ